MQSFFSNPIYLLGSFSVAACAAVALFLWLRGKRKAAASKPPAAESTPPGPAAAGGSDPVHAVLQTANARLKVSQKMKGASLSRLPAFLVIGPQGAGKTSAVLRSGLDPELLAGQVHQGVDIVPTKLNVWLARQVLFIEVSQALATDAQAFETILKYLRPTRVSSATQKTQPARAILLCTDQKTVAELRDPQQIAAAARPWNQCLSLAAAALGTQLPVYVLFSKLDGVAGFPEFVSKLAAKDLEQAIGATMPPFDPAGQGVYADETARLVDQHFTGIAGALCDSRVPLLIREQDHARIAVEYQFPRDFQKMQKNVVAFLVELAKPSQLQVSSFLRGFYFAGTRQVALEPGEGRTLPATPAPARPDAVAATVLLSQEQLRTQMSMLAKPSQGPRETTEWLFLSKLFEQVLLQDRSAHAASTSSSRSDRARAIAVGLAGAVGVFLLIALTVSYVRNRKLARDLAEGAGAIQAASSPVPLEGLERMRAPLDRLLEYRSHRPWTMHLGLYRGDELLRQAAAIYCTAMHPILQPTVDRMAGRLASMQTSGGDSSANLDLFKAYLMMTNNPEKADETVLPQQLANAWKHPAEGAGSQQPPQLLDAQLRTYAALLPISDPQNGCTFPPRQELIPRARSYVCGPNRDIYQALLQQAGQGRVVTYDSLFPNDAVKDGEPISRCFTREGWQIMHKILEHPEAFLKVDAWVCGKSKGRTQDELRAQADQLWERYHNDYVQSWTKYLKGATIAQYKSLGDAARKLETISGRGFLLILLGLSAENTAFDDQLKEFMPVKAVASNTTEFQTAKDYKQKLDSLKNLLEQAAGSKGSPSHDQDVQQVRHAVTAVKDAVDQIPGSSGFQGNIGEQVKRILLQPINMIPSLLDNQGLEAVNGAGKDLCTAFKQLAYRLPFAAGAPESGASPEEVQLMFHPNRGKAWQFYSQFLQDSLDCGSADCVRKSSPQVPLSEAFVTFFSGVDHWTHLLHGGRPELSTRLRVRALLDNNLRQLVIRVDDKDVTLLAGGPDQVIRWDGGSHKFRVTGVFGPDGEEPILFGLGPSPGPWEIFSWLWDAKSTGVGDFTWHPTSGRVNELHLKNGNSETYRLRIQLDDGSGPLSLSLGQCVPPTGR